MPSPISSPCPSTAFPHPYPRPSYLAHALPTGPHILPPPLDRMSCLANNALALDRISSPISPDGLIADPVIILVFQLNNLVSQLNDLVNELIDLVSQSTSRSHLVIGAQVAV